MPIFIPAIKVIEENQLQNLPIIYIKTIPIYQNKIYLT